MTYKLKYVDLSDEQIRKVKTMHISNTDDSIDDEQWARNAKSIMESEIEETEKAIREFLKDE